MTEETLKFIRTHKNLYRLLRDDSTLYEKIFQNNNNIYELEAMAKEKYQTRYIDKINKISKKIDILQALLDIFK